MNKENIKALRSETEALRMLIVGIEKRLEQQKILLDQLLEETEQEEERPQPVAEPTEAPQPSVVEPVITPKEESAVVTVEEQPQPVTPTVHAIIPTEAPTIKPQAGSLNDLLERKNLSDFRKAFSLNDRFRFRRELFGGSEELMNQVIADLNEIKSYDASMAYIQKVLNGNGEESAVADFLQLIEKRFA
ncbi:MAG: hypothetical protein ACI3ZY_10910 [Parabacteroides sp.]